MEINHLVSDALTVHISYFRDTELFSFWFWHVALQNLTLYDSDGGINQKIFIRLLIRYAMVVRYCNNEPLELYNCPTYKLQTMWNRHYTSVSKFVEQIHSMPEINSLYKWRVENHLSSIITKLDQTDNSDINKTSLSLNEREKINAYFRIGGNNYHGTLKNWLVVAKNLAKKIPKINGQFVSNAIPTQGPNNSDQFASELLTILITFHSHLEYVYSQFSDGVYDSSMLYRDYTAVNRRKHIVNDTNEENRLLVKFDELGGLFYLGYKERRNVFKYKVTFIKYLIDFSLKYKPLIITDLRSYEPREYKTTGAS